MKSPVFSILQTYLWLILRRRLYYQVKISIKFYCGMWTILLWLGHLTGKSFNNFWIILAVYTRGLAVQTKRSQILSPHTALLHDWVQKRLLTSLINKRKTGISRRTTREALKAEKNQNNLNPRDEFLFFSFAYIYFKGS